MADPKIAIKATLQHEGGFNDDPNDSGGATNMGVEQRDLPDINIRDLTAEQATDYYEKNYWKQNYSQIESQAIASKVFDLGVLFGVGTAVKILQNVLHLIPDGLFGEKTLAEVNDHDSASLLLAYKVAFVQHALAIGAANPKDREFISGWIRRINS